MTFISKLDLRYES
jgi:hypothetical protein